MDFIVINLSKEVGTGHTNSCSIIMHDYSRQSQVVLSSFFTLCFGNILNQAFSQNVKYGD